MISYQIYAVVTPSVALRVKSIGMTRLLAAVNGFVSVRFYESVGNVSCASAEWCTVPAPGTHCSILYNVLSYYEP
jgi:hypothetical protein